MQIDTLKSLKRYFKNEGFRSNFLYIGKATKMGYDDFGLERKDGHYIFSCYSERGAKHIIKEFDSEKDACIFVYNKLKDDDYGKSHCIKLTKSEKRTEKLGQKLKKKNIRYTIGKMPIRREKYLYQVIVFGRDEKKANIIKWFW